MDALVYGVIAELRLLITVIFQNLTIMVISLSEEAVYIKPA